MSHVLDLYVCHNEYFRQDVNFSREKCGDKSRIIIINVCICIQRIRKSLFRRRFFATGKVTFPVAETT